MTWIDQILSLFGNGNGKAITSTNSVWTRSRPLLFSSNPNSLLLNNWAPWNNDEKKCKDLKSIFLRSFHGRRRCRIVRSLLGTIRRRNAENGNENVKKEQKVLEGKTTPLHVHHTFFVNFFVVLHDLLNITFYGERKQATTKFYFSFWTWIGIPAIRSSHIW